MVNLSYFVISGASTVQFAIFFDQLKRIIVPAIAQSGRLHVQVTVNEYGLLFGVGAQFGEH